MLCNCAQVLLSLWRIGKALKYDDPVLFKESSPERYVTINSTDEQVGWRLNLLVAKFITTATPVATTLPPVLLLPPPPLQPLLLLLLTGPI